MRKLTRLCIASLSQRVDTLWCHCNKVSLVPNETHYAHCILELPLIGDVDCDATLHHVDTSIFGRWLLYDFDTGEIDHLYGLLVRCIDSSVYPSVVHGVRDPGPHVSWIHVVTG